MTNLTKQEMKDAIYVMMDDIYEAYKEVGRIDDLDNETMIGLVSDRFKLKSIDEYIDDDELEEYAEMVFAHREGDSDPWPYYEQVFTYK